jgi:cytoplasmic FMR1 interacting protein
VLDDLPIVDDQPCIEALSLTLDCRADFDTNFEDRNAFITGCSKYIEEATRHGEFVSHHFFLIDFSSYLNNY